MPTAAMSISTRNPRVLLLGGHGKVALLLTPLLLARSWDVVSLVRNPDHEGDILMLNNKFGDGKGKATTLASSLEEVKTNEDADRIFEKVKPDYVIWAAGMAR